MTEVIEMSRRGTAAYIEAMLLELRSMSEKEHLGVLTYLLEMALIEATELSHGILIRQEDHSDATSTPEGKRKSA